jgi:hypothetical protein
VVIKARGLAIENGLKVTQLVKENMGNIHSQARFYLMHGDKSEFKRDPNPENQTEEEMKDQCLVQSYEDYLA